MLEFERILDAELHNQPVPDDLTMADFIAGEDVRSDIIVG
jgi:hypothetical protein